MLLTGFLLTVAAMIAVISVFYWRAPTRVAILMIALIAVAYVGALIYFNMFAVPVLPRVGVPPR